MNSTVKRVLRAAIPIAVLAAGGALAYWLMSTKAEPARTEPEDQRPLVETQRVNQAPARLDVHGSGSVIAARDVVVQPQVSGRIIGVNDQLVPGGRVSAGERLFEVEPDDYRLAVRENKTQLAQAQAELDQELGRQKVARREWELFKDEVDRGADTGDPGLALRKPQLKSAQVRVDAAKAAVERAQLDLARTKVVAPFDAVVVSESADVGQLVNPQSQVARLVGTQTFWVRLSVPIAELGHIHIPGVNAQTGSRATIIQDVGNRQIRRDGHVVRLLGDLDQAGRMARLLVAIDDPFGSPISPGNDSPGNDSPGSAGAIPLLLNSYVDVDITGPKVDRLIEVPRTAVHEGNTVYVARHGTLDQRRVDIAWRRADTVLVSDGLADGDHVITSPLATPVDGMKLRRASANTDRPADQPDGRQPAADAGDAGAQGGRR